MIDDNENSNNSISSKMPTDSSEQEDLLEVVDVADLLSKSVYHAKRLKEQDSLKRKEQKDLKNNHGKGTIVQPKTYDTHHQDQSHEILQRALEVEDKFLDSTIDKLGLEMLTGDQRRKGWGRLIRAPLKKKGHILIDYCSAGCGGKDGGSCSNSSSNNLDGTKGRIIRQKVSRGWSARAAPGCYSAARKARWGGLWPDVSERVKLVEDEDFMRKVVKKGET
mmetsp:Transcript_13004/g.20646  ORF Transcript_13004/g.20646 Transcript_13004/m.20646 type:complete len:221 (+) Transcript_13004:1-663(+)